MSADSSCTLIRQHPLCLTEWPDHSCELPCDPNMQENIIMMLLNPGMALVETAVAAKKAKDVQELAKTFGGESAAAEMIAKDGKKVKKGKIVGMMM